MTDKGQLDFDDLTQSLEKVVQSEQHTLNGPDTIFLSRQYYEKNEPLLRAHLKAASILSRYDLPISAKFLTNFARYMTKYQACAHELVDVYADVAVEHGGDFKIPDITTPWLTRYLEKQGFRVKKARSKMDGCNA